MKRLAIDHIYIRSKIEILRDSGPIVCYKILVSFESGASTDFEGADHLGEAIWLVSNGITIVD
jgi:hypothetical protein